MGTEKDTELALKLYRRKFERTQNPVHLIGAFVFAHKFGKRPPVWVVEHMTKIFERFAEARGTVSLNKLFGFKRGRGQGAAFQETSRQHRESMVMLDVYTLKCLFNLTIAEAADMVVATEHSEDDCHQADKDSNRADRLAEKFSRQSWKKKFETDPYWSFLLKLNLDHGVKDPADYLRRFPATSWPLQLQRRYPTK